MNQTPPPPPPASPPPSFLPKELVRDPTSGLGGVASGLAHHLTVDVTLVRLAFVFAALTSGFGVIAYLAAWAIIPEATQWPPAGVVPPVADETPMPPVA